MKNTFIIHDPELGKLDLSDEQSVNDIINSFQQSIKKYYYHDANGQLRYVPEEKGGKGSYGLTQGRPELLQAYDHMKEQAIIQIEGDREKDPSIPADIRQTIQSIDISSAKDPVQAAHIILSKLPKTLAENRSISHSLNNWGKTFHMLLYSQAHPEVIPKS